MTFTRRRLLGVAGAAGVAMPAIVRAAPAPLNAAFFRNTSPFMIAKGEGWIDRAADSKVTWIEVGSGAEINTGIAGGSMDIGFGMGSSPAAAGISRGIPYEVIGMLDKIGQAEEMTVRKSAGIRTPADFRGKRVATPFGSTSHFRLLGFLKINGLSQREVTVLDMRPDAMVAAWARGDIDAGYVWSPAKSKLLAAGGETFTTYRKLEAAGYVTADVIVARTAAASADPQRVSNILIAYGRALELYKGRPDEAATLVGAQAGVSAEVAKADMAEYEFLPLREQLEPRWLGAPGKPGQFAGVLRNTADILAEQKNIRSAPRAATFGKAINTRYLSAAVG